MSARTLVIASGNAGKIREFAGLPSIYRSR